MGQGGGKLFSWAGEHSLDAGTACTSSAGTSEGDLCPGLVCQWEQTNWPGPTDTAKVLLGTSLD